MYVVVTEEYTVPPKWDTFAKCKLNWAGELHFKYYDSSKNSDELYCNEDIIVMKRANDNKGENNDRVLTKSFVYDTNMKE